MEYSAFEKLLNSHHVSVYQVSKATGISASTFSDWKNRRSTPKADKLARIADFFSISLDELLGTAEGRRNAEASYRNLRANKLVPVIGVLSWQMAAAAVTGFIAKENVVGTLAVCFGATQFINAEELALVEGEAANAAALMTGINGAGEIVSITAVAALAYLMFNLFSPPCFAAIGAMNAEMKDTKWLLGGIALQLGMGYTVGFFVYQIGTLLATGTLGAAFLPGGDRDDAVRPSGKEVKPWDRSTIF